MSIRDLCDACRAGDMQAVETILARGEVDVNGGDQYGNTPLIYAMMQSCQCGCLSNIIIPLFVLEYNSGLLHTVIIHTVQHHPPYHTLHLHSSLLVMTYTTHLQSSLLLWRLRGIHTLGRYSIGHQTIPPPVVTHHITRKH